MAETQGGKQTWPMGAVDTGVLRAAGWRPMPLREFVIKIHQRCNLACDYCYVYTMADRSWRNRPAVMPAEVWAATARRIAEHVQTHRLSQVAVVFHGGEPMLAGTPMLVAVADAVRGALPPEVECRIGIQTNGVLLTEDRLGTLLAHDIRIAVSVDGQGADHDAHRRYRDGRGSWTAVRRALDLLRTDRFHPIFAGLLCTIDPAVDPVACYQALLEHEPPAVDVLLPHANWATGIEQGVFGWWLARMFDVYFDQPVRHAGIRLFDEIVNLHLGGASRSEHVGLSPAAVAVVESDGAIEQTDALRSTFPGAAATGLSVLTDPFDAALEHPGVVARQLGVAALCDTCRSCELREVCGGGHYAHRYRPETGFLNPSVYCEETAFGALALTLPERPEHLAATMVHEFQHSKLSAFLDLLPLYDPQAKGKYFAPWRPDPRPIGSLLQGAYAFSAVGDLWHHLRDHAGDSVDATRHFAELREQVRQVIDTLVGSPHLNEDGRQFVAQLREAHAAQMTVRLPKTVVSSSHAALSETFAAWRARNSR